MTAILRDLLWQLVSLVAVVGLVCVALAIAWGTRCGYERLRAWWRERRAVRRVSRQSALGVCERITGGVIAGRRR